MWGGDGDVGDVGSSREFSDHALDRVPSGGTADVVEEELVPSLDVELRPGGLDVGCQRSDGGLSDGDDPLLPPLSRDSHDSGVEIDVLNVEPAQLADSDSRGVQQFQDGPVPKALRGGGIDAGHESSDLVVGEDAGRQNGGDADLLEHLGQVDAEESVVLEESEESVGGGGEVVDGSGLERGSLSIDESGEVSLVGPQMVLSQAGGRAGRPGSCPRGTAGTFRSGGAVSSRCRRSCPATVSVGRAPRRAPARFPGRSFPGFGSGVGSDHVGDGDQQVVAQSLDGGVSERLRDHGRMGSARQHVRGARASEAVRGHGSDQSRLRGASRHDLGDGPRSHGRSHAGEPKSLGRRLGPRRQRRAGAGEVAFQPPRRVFSQGQKPLLPSLSPDSEDPSWRYSIRSILSRELWK